MKPSRLICFLIPGTCVFLASCKPGEEPAAASKEIATAEATTAADAFLVLPGDYAESTTAANLEARFGKANVSRETEPEPRVVLFPEDPTRRAFVTFYDEETLEHLAGITVTDAGSRWRGKHGVHIGMTMAQVQALNRKPFYFFVDHQHRQGRAHDGWSPALDDYDGSLGAFDVEEGEHLYFDVILGPADSATLKALPGQPEGEQISSDDPRYRELREVIVVTGIGASSSMDDEW